MEDEKELLRAQLKAALALSSQESHSGSVGSNSTSRAADDFFSMTEVGGGNAGFGSGSGFGNAGGMTQVKAKPKLGEGVQAKPAGVTGAAAASVVVSMMVIVLTMVTMMIAAAAAEQPPTHPLSGKPADPFADLGKL